MHHARGERRVEKNVNSGISHRPPRLDLYGIPVGGRLQAVSSSPSNGFGGGSFVGATVH